MNATHRIVAAIIGASATSLGAQQPERAVFMVRLGHDTLAVETASLAPRHFEGDLRYRTPLLRVRRTLAFSSSFDLEALDITIGAGVRGDSARTHTVLTIVNDSADIASDAVAGSAARRTRVGFARGSIPFNNLSGLTLELILRRARIEGGDTVTVPLFLGRDRACRYA